MATISPVDNELYQLVKSDVYRGTLNRISEKYATMDQFINNLTSDINEIGTLIDRLLRDQKKGYDIGTSLDTLTFQKDTLTLDRDFFVNQKNTYLRKIYKDLYKYTDGIISKCIEIEDNPQALDEKILKQSKLAGSRPFDEEDNTLTFVMSDVFSLLSVTERNLLELAADIATFDGLIDDATKRESRGFSVGNMILNLKQQKSSLDLGFRSYCIRLEQFLEENYKFSSKCVKRIEMISQEIQTEEELEKKEESKQEDPDAVDPNAVDPNAVDPNAAP